MRTFGGLPYGKMETLLIYVRAGGGQVAQATSLPWQTKFRIVKFTPLLHGDDS